MIQGEQNKKAKTVQRNYRKFYVDFNAAVSNNLVSLEAPIKYLNANIKVNGVKNKLGESVKVGSTDKKDK